MVSLAPLLPIQRDTPAENVQRGAKCGSSAVRPGGEALAGRLGVPNPGGVPWMWHSELRAGHRVGMGHSTILEGFSKLGDSVAAV